MQSIHICSVCPCLQQDFHHSLMTPGGSQMQMQSLQLCHARPPLPLPPTRSPPLSHDPRRQHNAMQSFRFSSRLSKPAFSRCKSDEYSILLPLDLAITTRKDSLPYIPIQKAVTKSSKSTGGSHMKRSLALCIHTTPTHGSDLQH